MRKLMDEALEAFPDDPELCLRYAMASVPASPVDAAKYVRRAGRLSSDDPYRLTRCASLLYGLGEVEDAGKYVRSVLPLIDENFPLIADVFHLVGVLAVAKANDTVADEYLRLAFKVEPTGSGHAYELAHFLVVRGRREDALDVIAEALEHDSPDRERLLELRESFSGWDTGS